MYFTCEEDIHLGGPVVECYGLESVSPQIHMLKSDSPCDNMKRQD